MTTVSQMEGGWFSKCGYRLSAAHIHFKHLQELPRLRPDGFQTMALALAPRTFFFSRIEGGSFSNCGSRLSAAHIRF
eukprot:349259-Pyramimonas_sp.AAC.1